MRTEAHASPVLEGAPGSASCREYLRRGVPAVYRQSGGGADREPFAMRFLTALEEVLDPIVTTLDVLAAHLELELAPPYMVDAVAAWLGVELDAGLRREAHIRLVRHAVELSRARGTKAGLEQTLELAFGRSDFEVHESGLATWSTEREIPSAPDPKLTVVCPRGMGAEQRAAVARVVEEVKPAHVSFELMTGEGEAA